ncbi:Integral membrane protein [hydrothermal vent metagenome]|uniref:Integral membrane protein n=1 Tax=hydrothermal vent metagenome TaxID=652676 RepID=A0A1W1BZN2_9ZZZZ
MNIFYDYYVDIFRNKYIAFSGRASRKEFWYFMLFNFMITVIFFVIDVFLGTVYVISEAPNHEFSIGLGFVYTWATFIPSLALSFRRLHDIGRKAWWLFIPLVPILGFFILLYFYLKAGEKGNNTYGASPWKVIEELEDNVEVSSSSNSFGHESDKNTKLKKIAKFVGITLLVIFVIAGGILFFMGGAIFSMGQAVVESANNVKIENKIENKEGVISITLPLKESYILEYDNLKLCTPKANSEETMFQRIDAGEFTSNNICQNGICTVSIALEDIKKYPPFIFAYVEEGSLCQKKRISTKTKPIVSEYEGLIEMTAELLEMLGVKGNAYRVSASKTRNTNMWQVMGTKKVTFSYPKRIYSDSLMIDGVVKAKLIYQDTKNMRTVVMPPISSESIEKKVPKVLEKPSVDPLKGLTLSEQKKVLEDELKHLQAEEAQTLKDERDALMKELESLKG